MCLKSAGSARPACSTLPGASPSRWCRGAGGWRRRSASLPMAPSSRRWMRLRFARRRGLPGGARGSRRRVLHQFLRQRCARAPRRRDPARGSPVAPCHRLVRGAARDQGIRAHLDRGGERLSSAGDARLSLQARRAPCRHRRHRAGAGDGLQRRDDRNWHGARPAGVRGRLRTCRRRRGRRAARSCRSARATSSSSTWAARPPRRRSSRAASRRSSPNTNSATESPRRHASSRARAIC